MSHLTTSCYTYGYQRIEDIILSVKDVVDGIIVFDTKTTTNRYHENVRE